MKKYWFLAVLLPIALVINENIIHWALAITVGNKSMADGFSDAFRHFSFWGYFFFTAFRLVPYVGLAISLVALSRSKYSDYVPVVLTGGLTGILYVIISGSWSALHPYYTDQQPSSTTALSFLFIPIIAIFSGAFGSALLAVLYMSFRRTKNKEHSE